MAEKPKPKPKSKRPADVIGNAVRVMQIATGEAEEEEKDPKAVERGEKGGKARANKLTKKQRQEIARKAATVRWAAKSKKE